MSKLKMRTHHCGELTAANTDQQATLCGWIASHRDHGGVIFIDLRDRYGITQIVVDPNMHNDPALKAVAEKLRMEFVIQIQGKVRPRPESMVNPKIKTGEIELIAEKIEVLSESETPPFVVEDDIDANENLRLKYRYLDLRRPSLQNNLITRHRVFQAMREYLNELDFIEVETPYLFKSTPEGARDFLVPSRIHGGSFYALPQSPQIMKQLLMIASFDRYYQIARCFRDEDLRADRQPEFSQLDIEMSFVKTEDIQSMVEGLVGHIFEKVVGVKISMPFEHITYHEAMELYGVDKPDLRFDMKLFAADKAFAETGFNAFKSVLQTGGRIKGIRVQGGATYSRKDIDELTKFVGRFGAKGLAWFKYGDEISSPIKKFLSDAEINALTAASAAENGDLVLLVADTEAVTNASLGQLRLLVGEREGLIDKSAYRFVWVDDFPLLEYDIDSKRYVACHHPFTEPKPEDADLLLKQESLEKIRASAYDLVLNGHEVAGGSIRIHRQDIQQAMFRALAMSEKEISENFGFFVEALKYGTPPHGGIAFGLDRMIMILCGTDAIREVMAFPKTQKASCLMSEAPSTVSPEQLAELSIAVNKPKL